MGDVGVLVAVEGLDGSGKATQTQMLAGRLEAMGARVRAVSFPNYESDSCALVRMYLSGAFGTRPGDVNAFAASAFYAVDRYAAFNGETGDFYRGGGLVLADRYTTSNAIHQCAKLPEGEWERYCEWLWDFEYEKLCIPRPDLVICLDAEPRVSAELLMERYNQDDRRDIHERDAEYMERCRRAAHWCAGRFGWRLVACTRGGRMRGRGDIADEVERIVRAECFPGEAGL